MINLPDNYDPNDKAEAFPIVKPGKYNAVIRAVEIRKDSINPYLLITWDIGEGTVRSTQSLSPAAMPFLASLLDALNITVSRKSTFFENVMIGRAAKITVSVERTEKGERNSVKMTERPEGTPNEPILDASDPQFDYPI